MAIVASVPDAQALTDKQRRLRDGFPVPLALRVHRALSWLCRAEQERAAPDARFVLLWSGFNAAYAGDVAAALEGEREQFRAFFAALVRLDAANRLYARCSAACCRCSSTR